MPNLALTCIVEDGTLPADGTLPRVATRQDITFPVGYSGAIALTVQHASGAAFDLTGCSVDFVARLHASDAVPALAYAAILYPAEGGGISLGDGVVSLLAADTADLVAGAVYWFDVRLTTVATPPVEDQVVAPSQLAPRLAIARAGEPA